MHDLFLEVVILSNNNKLPLYKVLFILITSPLVYLLHIVSEIYKVFPNLYKFSFTGTTLSFLGELFGLLVNKNTNLWCYNINDNLKSNKERKHIIRKVKRMNDITREQKSLVIYMVRETMNTEIITRPVHYFRKDSDWVIDIRKTDDWIDRDCDLAFRLDGEKVYLCKYTTSNIKDCSLPKGTDPNYLYSNKSGYCDLEVDKKDISNIIQHLSETPSEKWGK